MPDVWCQGVFTEEDDQLIREAQERAANAKPWTPPPAVQDQLEALYIEDRQGNAKDFWERAFKELVKDADKAELRKKLKEPAESYGRVTARTDDPAEQIYLDFFHWPTDAERKIAYRTSLQLGMSQCQAASVPEITGFGVEDTTPLIQEAIQLLHSSKLPLGMRESYSVNKITFIDRRFVVMQDPPDRITYGAVASANVRLHPHPLGETNREGHVPLSIRLFSDGNGQFHRGEKLLWDIAHESCHLQEIESNGAKSGIFKPVARALKDPIGRREWYNAVQVQMLSKPVSFYAYSSLFPDDPIGAASKKLRPEDLSEDSIEKTGHDFHFIAEHFAAWVTNSKHDSSPKIGIAFKAGYLCLEMKQFFNKHVPATFQ